MSGVLVGEWVGRRKPMSRTKKSAKSKRRKAEPPVLKNLAPIPVRESQYWLCLTQTQCLALADGVVPTQVRSMAGMVDRPNPAQGISPYAVINTRVGQ